MKQHVEPSWLKDRLNDGHIRVVDCRFNLGNPDSGRLEYQRSHIPGAVYFDLEEDLSGPVREHGGRHPLPDLEELKAKLEKAGIENDSVLVAYDAKEGAFSSRFWWIMNYIGHEQVYILDGGLEAWREEGFLEDSLIPDYPPSSYTISVKSEMVASYEEVRDIALNGKEGTILIDSREEKRFLGEEEPIDRIPGHIPAAINKPWMEGFKNGRFKSKEEQVKRFSGISKELSLIVYCGSGVTATPNYIALKEAGYENVKLYTGSYSDWVSYEHNPVSKGKEG